MTFKTQITTPGSFLLFNSSLCLQNPGLLISCFLLSCVSFQGPRGSSGSKQASPEQGAASQDTVRITFQSWQVPNDLKWLHLFRQVIKAASRGSPTLRNTTARQLLVRSRLQPPVIGTWQLSLSPSRDYFFIIKGSLLPLCFFVCYFFHDEQIWLGENITVRLRMRSINVLIIWKAWTFVRYFKYIYDTYINNTYTFINIIHMDICKFLFLFDVIFLYPK